MKLSIHSEVVQRNSQCVCEDTSVPIAHEKDWEWNELNRRDCYYDFHSIHYFNPQFAQSARRPSSVNNPKKDSLKNFLCNLL